MRSRNNLALALLVAGCSGGERPRIPVGGSVRYDATGLASWYGAELAGRPTASGERFDPRGLTAAHRTLPFGTLVEVTALDTGRAVVVRINDRGPHRGGRLIDLSAGAAQLLGSDRLARPEVRVRALRRGEHGRLGLSRNGRIGVAKPAGDAMMARGYAAFTDAPSSMDLS